MSDAAGGSGDLGEWVSRSSVDKGHGTRGSLLVYVVIVWPIVADRRWIATSAPATGLFTVALFSSQVSGKAQMLLKEQPAREGARRCKAFWEATYPLPPPPTFATRRSSVGFPGGGPPPSTRKHCLVLGNARGNNCSCIDTVGAQSRSSEKNSNRFTARVLGSGRTSAPEKAECSWWFVGCDGPNRRYITISWGRCARGNRPRSSLLRMATKRRRCRIRPGFPPMQQL